VAQRTIAERRQLNLNRPNWASANVPVITTLEVQKRNKERVNVYLDGEYAFSLGMMEAARLQRGQTLTEADITRLKDEDLVVRAVESASRFLGHRPRSVAEVHRNLSEKDFDAGVIDAALERLTRLGYLDDWAFARYWIQNRTQFKPLGRSALRFELRHKGVPDAIIQAVLDEVDDESGAYQAAAALLKRMRGADRKTARHKLSATLSRRGFRFDDIRTAIDQLFEEIDEEDPRFFGLGGDSADSLTDDD
jgi:regulatory protein